MPPPNSTSTIAGVENDIDDRSTRISTCALKAVHIRATPEIYIHPNANADVNTRPPLPGSPDPLPFSTLSNTGHPWNPAPVFAWVSGIDSITAPPVFLQKPWNPTNTQPSSPAMSDAFEDDLLLRKPFADQLEKFLLTEHQFVEGALVVSLHAPFGAGKTTFIRMWCDDLQQRRHQDPTLPRPIILNAWESDYCGDPLIALISAISIELKDSPDSNHQQANNLREAAKDAGNFAIALANSLVSSATGLDPLAAGEYAETKKTKRSQPNKKPFNALDAYESKRDALQKLKDELSNIFGAEKPKAIIIIDELDRCRPDYAISYLETIKHIFDQRGLIFVIAADPLQLQSATKALFGPDIHFDDYYRKFIQRRILLPEADKNALQRFVHHYIQRYISSPLGNRLSLLDSLSDYHNHIFSLLEGEALNPRQIQEVFRIMGHTLSCNKDQENTNFMWAYAQGTILMSMLHVVNPSLYKKIGHSKASAVEVGEFLKGFIHNEDEFEWWLKIFITGYLDPKNTNEIIPSLRLSPNRKSATSEECYPILSQSYQGWSRSASRHKQHFKVIYETIEQIKSFSE